MLVERGADPELTDSQGVRPAEYWGEQDWQPSSLAESDTSLSVGAGYSPLHTSSYIVGVNYSPPKASSNSVGIGYSPPHTPRYAELDWSHHSEEGSRRGARSVEHTAVGARSVEHKAVGARNRSVEHTAVGARKQEQELEELEEDQQGVHQQKQNQIQLYIQEQAQGKDHKEEPAQSLVKEEPAQGKEQEEEQGRGECGWHLVLGSSSKAGVFERCLSRSLSLLLEERPGEPIVRLAELLEEQYKEGKK